MSFKVNIAMSNITSKDGINVGKNVENKHAGLRRMKTGKSLCERPIDKQVTNVRVTRPPLAQLDGDASVRQNTNRLQNSQRQGLCKNNTFCTSSKFPSVPPPRNPFKIFNDEENDENADVTAVNKQDLDQTKSSEVIAPLRQPLSTLYVNSELCASSVNPEESPMVVDSIENDTNAVSQTDSTCSVKKQISKELLADEYAKDIYDYLLELEARCRAKPNYMTKQPDVTHGMRSILVDWLVEVTEEYRLQTETLYLAVSYIDRFLSCMSVLRSKLQLVGTASMLLAAKFEEIYPPDVEEFVFITDDTYTQAQVLRMEQVILKVLKFDLAAPTIFCFLQRFSHLHDVEEKCHNLAMYLCELTLLEADPFLKFLPSIIAGSALCLACHTLDKEPWSSQMTETTGYTVDDFQLCVTSILKSYRNAAEYPQQAIREKYRSEKFFSVANLSPPLSVPF